MVESIYFSSVYNHRMHPLPLGKEILKTKNYFWGLILIVRGILRNNTVFKYTSQIWVLFYPISITFGIYILNLLRKSSCPIASATVFFRCFQKYLHSANCGLDYPPPPYPFKNTTPCFLTSPIIISKQSKLPFLGNLPPLYYFFRESFL